MGGTNIPGQLGRGTNMVASTPTVMQVPGINFQVNNQAPQISTFGSGGSAAIATNGRLYVWGTNTNGKLGLSPTTYPNYPTEIYYNYGTAGLWKKISTGFNHSLVVLSGGQLFVSGTNSKGQLGTSAYTSASSFTQSGNASWIDVRAGDEASWGIRTSGRLYAWGKGGMLGLGGNTANQTIPLEIGGNATNWSKIVQGPSHGHAGAIKQDGRLYMWGDNTYGQLGTGNFNSSSSIALVKAPPSITTSTSPSNTICAGGSVTLSSTGASNYSWTGAISNGVPFTPVAPGTYTVTATDANGCTNSSSIKISFHSLPAKSSLALANSSRPIPQDSVSTYAGSGAQGSANGTIATASFYRPNDMAIDGAGNMYVTDGGNYSIRKITPAGIVSTLAGGSQGNSFGLGSAAKFDYPSGIAADKSSGFVYVSDRYNCVIKRITPAGSVQLLAGSTPGYVDASTYNARFNQPEGLAVDSSGNVYVADQYNNVIRKIQLNGNTITFAGSSAQGSADGIGTAASFHHPRGLDIDAQGNLYVAESAGRKIRKITPDGVVTTIAGTGAFGNLDGSVTAATFSGPYGIVVDASGKILYVVDGNRIRKVVINGMVTTIAGSTQGFADGVGTAAMFSALSGLTKDDAGNLYGADVLNNRIRKIVLDASSSLDTICTRDTIKLVGNGGVSYSWASSAALFAAGGDSVLSAPSTNTDYVVTVTNSLGCISTDTVSLVVNGPNLAISLSPNNSICLGESVNLSATGASSYSWTGSVTNGVPFVPPFSGSYTVTGTDSTGCTDTASTIVTVANAASPTSFQDDFESGVLSTTWTTGTQAQTATILNTGSPQGLNHLQLSITSGGVHYQGLNATITPSQITECSWWIKNGSFNNSGNVVLRDGTTSNNLGIVWSTFHSSGSIRFIGSSSTVYDYPASANTWYHVELKNWNWTAQTYDIYINNTLAYASFPFRQPATSVGRMHIYNVGNPATCYLDDIKLISAPQGINISSASANNATSMPGTETGSKTQAANTAVMYFDANCNLITTIDSSVAGLGLTQAMVTVDTTVPLYNGQPYAARWYQITPSNTGIAADVILCFTQNDFDDYNVTAALGGWPLLPTNATDISGIANVRVTKNDNVGLEINPVTITPTSVVWDSVNSYWQVKFSTPSFSQFRIHGVNPGNTALPINLKTFTVKKQLNSDLVKWTTATENNNSHFNVQRSATSFDFETLGKVYSQGNNSTKELNYSFVDETPQIGNNYYRLEQVDVDGNNSYSNIINIIWSEKGTISIYPNPTSDKINLDFTLEEDGLAKVKLLDMSGRVVKSVWSKVQEGSNHIEISMSELANGLYHVQLVENNVMLYQGKVNKE